MISFRTNPASFNAIGRLASHTKELRNSYTRLSSGLRINKSADDAAGLAISSSLDLDAKIYKQANRNINDSVSLLSIAEGTLNEANNILIRQKELAAQASNGSMSYNQRGALDDEFRALTDEYNRIISSAEFNGQKLLDGTFGASTVQAGYGNQSGIGYQLGEDLARIVGDGTFQAGISYSTAAQSSSIATGDFDNDGILDLVNGNAGANNVWVMLGVGDGTFKTAITFNNPSGVTDFSIADRNGDGHQDLIVGNFTNSISVFLGNGNGTFKSSTTYVTAGSAVRLAGADYNGDGVLDIATADTGSNSMNILLGNSDGSFRASLSFDAGGSTNYIAAGDFNNDGIIDIANGGSNGGVFLGNGNGTFKSRIQVGIEAADNFAVGDFNDDNNLDIVSSFNAGSFVRVIFGNGNGTFDRSLTLTTTGAGPGGIGIGDVNGDGVDDISVSIESANRVNVFTSQANGTFAAVFSVQTGTTPYAILIEDLTGDGATEIVTANFGGSSISVISPNTATSTTEARISIATTISAREAMDELENSLQRLRLETGSIGALQNRLGFANSVIEQSTENFITASSQIKDVDVALESSNLLKHQILQQAATAIISQSSLLQEQALLLIRS